MVGVLVFRIVTVGESTFGKRRGVSCTTSFSLLLSFYLYIWTVDGTFSMFVDIKKRKVVYLKFCIGVFNPTLSIYRRFSCRWSCKS